MKRVLVTGSLGYLGSALTGFLAQNGFECLGYDTGFFKDCVLYEPPGTKTLLRDARDLEEKDLEGIGALVHLAGISNDPFGDLDAAKVYDPTREYSSRIARLCKKQGVKFIFASSCSIYGRSEGNLVDEDSPVFPQTAYSLNKAQIEEDLRSLGDRTFSPIALRFATAFGLSSRLRFDIVVNMLVGMAFSTGRIVLNSDGTPWRPHVHVLDICKSILCAIKSDYAEGKLLVLNVGDEKNNHQIIDVARKVQAQLPGCDLKFLKESPELDKEGLVKDRNVNSGVDKRTYRVSFARVREVFKGFTCDWDVDRGITQLIDKFKALGLTEKQFKDRNYYRLKKIEHLYQNHYLSPDLRWIEKRV